MKLNFIDTHINTHTYIINKFINNNKCIHANGMLENGLMYLK